MEIIATNVRIIMVTKFDRRTRVYSNVNSISTRSDSGLYEIRYEDENNFLCVDLYNIHDVAKMSIGPKKDKAVNYDGRSIDGSRDDGCNGKNMEV